MLITQTVKIKWSYGIKKYYESRGYIFTSVGDEFECKVTDLSPNSHTKIRYRCNCCKEEVECQYSSYSKNASDICSKCRIDMTKQRWNDKRVEQDFLHQMRKEQYRRGE